MMGLFNATSKMMYKPRASAEDDKVPDDTEPDDTSILSVPLLSLSACPVMRFPSPADPFDDFDDCRDENEGSIIASLISQLR